MNPYSEDHPDLTRFALDELPTAESAAMHDAVAHHASLQVEVAQIQEIAHQLRAQTPIYDLRLTAPQRQRILQGPTAKPTAQSPQASAMAKRPCKTSWSFIGAVTRIAAMVALLLSTFWLGFTAKNLLNADEDQVAESAPPLPELVNSPATNSGSNKAVESINQQEGVEFAARSQPEANPPLSSDVISSSPIEPESQEQAIASAPVVVVPPQDQPIILSRQSEASPPAPLATSLGITEPAQSVAFVNASRRGSDSLPIRPKSIRPAPPTAAKHSLQAKPLSPNEKGAPAVPAARARPDLFVHAWLSEVASCPWNSEHRLLRITIQLPSDQEAAQIGDHSYPLDVTFDPNNVREFRRLCSRHYPSPEQGHAGKVVVWYEFQPNGTPAENHGNGKHIANVHLTAARFTTQTVGPFDASQVQVLDRGQSWQQARGDFVFESAQVGLQLLMDGAPQIGQLNQKLVLELAEHAQSADPTGSRSLFIKTLNDLQRLTGRK